MSLVPLMIDMIGLPIEVTWWIYPYFYPIERCCTKKQHYFLLALMTWLVTIGPKKDLLGCLTRTKIKKE